MVDSHSFVNEKYREMFPEYDRGLMDALKEQYPVTAHAQDVAKSKDARRVREP